jgi:predicted RNase H-like nuclease (RuvC/YqgF family)
VTGYSIPTRSSSLTDITKPAAPSIPQQWIRQALEDENDQLREHNCDLEDENHALHDEIERLKRKLALSELDTEYWQARADRYGSLDRLLDQNKQHLDEVAMLMDSWRESQVKAELRATMEKERARANYWQSKFDELYREGLGEVTAVTGELQVFVAHP